LTVQHSDGMDVIDVDDEDVVQEVQPKKGS